MLFLRNTLIAIKFFDKRVRAGRMKTYCRKFVCHSDKMLVWEAFCAVFKKLRGAKRFMDKRGETTFSFENILSQSAK